MHQPASLPLRWLYCLALVSVILPFGMSGWVAMSVGGGPLQSLPFVGPLLFLGLGVWRIGLVIRHRDTLDAFVDGPAVTALRRLGIGCMAFGAVHLALRLTTAPLIHSLTTHRSESGVEFYVAGLFLALLGGAAALGLLLFEFSRLLGFERRARRAAPLG
ncbi:hypothetical protein [Azohydromonas aeria]|uniref:hypothetical protein n=1 Tax=Azohydromonas aeria TaxID=2590212 RepID=UPI0012FB78F8|nr:hypothetical protein [Azohydromonas aeria]